MSPHDELDLNEIDALLGEDDFDDVHLVSDDEDEFDELLGAEDDDFDEDEDSLDELLGAIDTDYLSQEEQVFLQNKAFLDSHATSADLDNFFMKFQETLYGAMIDYVGDEEEFGADEDDDLQDLEIESELLGGHAFGSDEEAEAFVEEAAYEFDESLGLDDDEFDEYGANIATTASHLDAARKSAGLYMPHEVAAQVRKASARKARRMNRRLKGRSRRWQNRSQRKAIIASKRRYLREMRRLTACTRRFNALAKKVSPDVAIKLIASKNKFVRRPFTTVTLAAQRGAGKNLQSFFERGMHNYKDRRLARIANRCDRRYQRLQKVWMNLRARGKTSGLRAPRYALSGILQALSMRAKQASKRSGGMIPAATVSANPRLRNMSAIQMARRRKAAELARLRAADIKARQRSQQRLAKAKMSAARQSILERKREQASSIKEAQMVASNPYMDAADLKALSNARTERMTTSAIRRRGNVINASQQLARQRSVALRRAEIERRRRQQALARKRQAEVARMRRQVAMQNKARMRQQKVSKPTYVSRTPTLKTTLKNRLATMERQLAHTQKLHRESLAKQKQFGTNSVPWKAQYNYTKKYASRSVQLRGQIAQVKSQLAAA